MERNKGDPKPVQRIPVFLKVYQYRKRLKLCVIFSLVFIIILFQYFRSVRIEYDISVKLKPPKVKVVDIPKTFQWKPKPPPQIPEVPVPSEEETVPEDEVIPEFNPKIFTENIPPPPPWRNPQYGPEGELDPYVFIPYEKPPEPVGGYKALQKRLRYPEIARKVGLEIRLVILALIVPLNDKEAYVKKAKIIHRSWNNKFFDEAVLEAIMGLKWTPAMQRDKPVKVWISIPVIFELK